MSARALPIIITHRIEELRRRGARAAKRLQRRAHVALVVVQTYGIGVLIIALNHRMVLDQESPKPKCAGGFAIREMVHDLSRAPLAGNWVRGQQGGGKSCQVSRDLIVAVFIFGY